MTMGDFYIKVCLLGKHFNRKKLWVEYKKKMFIFVNSLTTNLMNCHPQEINARYSGDIIYKRSHNKKTNISCCTLLNIDK